MKNNEFQKVYLETSIISYLAAKESRDPIIKARQMITKKWWSAQAKSIEPFISIYVIEEIEKGDKTAANLRRITMKDPIIQEIRTIRHDLDEILSKTPKDFDNDIESIRKRYSKRIVSRQGKPKKLKAA